MVSSFERKSKFFGSIDFEKIVFISVLARHNVTLNLDLRTNFALKHTSFKGQTADFGKSGGNRVLVLKNRASKVSICRSIF